MEFRIDNGFLTGAEFNDSPNSDERPENEEPQLIVIHCISLPPGEFGGLDIHRLFTNQLDFNADPFFSRLSELKVSAHFLIDRSGEVTQFVSCLRRAWHAGSSEWKGRSNCNDYSIGIELEGIDTEVFDPRQYESLRKLCHALVACYPIEGMAGHSHIAKPSGRKKDPGQGFNWAELSNFRNLELPVSPR